MISAKTSAYVGQNIEQNENISSGISGGYVGANILVFVSAKISAGRIYIVFELSLGLLIDPNRQGFKIDKNK